MKKWILLLSFLLTTVLFDFAAAAPVTEQKQQSLTPKEIVQKLKSGNQAFADGTDLSGSLELMKKGAEKGQFPLSIVLSCVDSRSVPEVTLGQNKGAMFAARVAGNVVNKDILGSMEFAIGFAGTKVILVMGHTSCGAVAGACAMNGQFQDNLKYLLESIRPAVKMAQKIEPNGKCDDPNFVNLIAKENVKYQIQQILKNSALIRKLVKEKKVIILGGMHDIATGKVTFFNEE